MFYLTYLLLNYNLYFISVDLFYNNNKCKLLRIVNSSQSHTIHRPCICGIKLHGIVKFKTIIYKIRLSADYVKTDEILVTGH